MSESDQTKVRSKRNKGPLGLGDPDDLSLRKVEEEVLIPKKLRDIAHAEKCPQQVTDFTECCKDAGLKMVVQCRPQNTALWQCLEKWYFDEEFKARCRKEYLDERSEFRRTGIKKKPKNYRAELRKLSAEAEAKETTAAEAHVT